MVDSASFCGLKLKGLGVCRDSQGIRVCSQCAGCTATFESKTFGCPSADGVDTHSCECVFIPNPPARLLPNSLCAVNCKVAAARHHKPPSMAFVLYQLPRHPSCPYHAHLMVVKYCMLPFNLFSAAQAVSWRSASRGQSGCKQKLAAIKAARFIAKLRMPLFAPVATSSLTQP